MASLSKVSICVRILRPLQRRFNSEKWFFRGIERDGTDKNKIAALPNLLNFLSHTASNHYCRLSFCLKVRLVTSETCWESSLRNIENRFVRWYVVCLRWNICFIHDCKENFSVIAVARISTSYSSSLSDSAPSSCELNIRSTTFHYERSV